jgi:hypothetical protein
MSKHNELRDKINELCPELMKLEFGCVCRNIEFDYEFIICGRENPEAEYSISEDRMITYHIRNLLHGDPTGIENMEVLLNPKKTEILGKDPTLEDVIKAMTLAGGNRWNMVTYKNGLNAGKIAILREDQKRFIYWQLGKPISAQSSETVEKILEILK